MKHYVIWSKWDGGDIHIERCDGMEKALERAGYLTADLGPEDAEDVVVVEGVITHDDDPDFKLATAAARAAHRLKRDAERRQKLEDDAVRAETHDRAEYERLKAKFDG